MRDCLGITFSSIPYIKCQYFTSVPYSSHWVKLSKGGIHLAQVTTTYCDLTPSFPQTRESKFFGTGFHRQAFSRVVTMVKDGKMTTI